MHTDSEIAARKIRLLDEHELVISLYGVDITAQALRFDQLVSVMIFQEKKKMLNSSAASVVRLDRETKLVDRYRIINRVD